MWIWIALGAAFAQTVRNAVARSLSPHISPTLNSWSRFAFSLPYATVLLAVVYFREGALILSAAYFAYCALTAIAQLLGNVFLVAAFRHANFAQSIVYLKLEVLLTAIVGAAFFREIPSIPGWVGVFLCALGVLWMNGASRPDDSVGAERKSTWRLNFGWDRGAFLALSAGVWLVLASFMLKAANTTLVLANSRVGNDRFEVATHTLFHVIWIEVLFLSVWIYWRQRAELSKIRRRWTRMALVGLASFLGSLGWFWAFSLTLIAYVKAVGQVEAVFAVALSLIVWKEREVVRQIPGMLLILVGIALVLFG